MIAEATHAFGSAPEKKQPPIDDPANCTDSGEVAPLQELRRVLGAHVRSHAVRPVTEATIEFEPETAGRHMVPVVTATEGERVTDVLARLIERGPEHHDTIHVIDDDKRLRGIVRLLSLVSAPPDASIGALMNQVPAVHGGTDQEIVAQLALREQLSEVPVTNRDGVLVGAVPALALIAILRAEHHEDMDRLAGIRRQQNQAVDALRVSPIRRLVQRAPWLLVGLAASVVGAVFATRFESLLAHNVALAFFLPTVIYLADAIGTQTEAIVVRGLAVGSASGARVVAGELATGTMLGVLLAIVALPIVAAISGAAIALTVAVALLAAAMLAAGISLLLSWGLHRAGIDPAYGAGPLGTAVQDVATLFIYLSVAFAIVGR